MTRRCFSWLAVAVFTTAFGGIGAGKAVADGSPDVSFQVQAPVDATNCAATPPTITVLGLIIDTTNAVFDSGESGGSSGSDDSGGTAGGCSGLNMGDVAEVTLTSDTDPLAATEVDPEGGSEDASLLGPIQNVDTSAQTLTLFGLLIDASHASVEGEDADDNPAGPSDLSQLTMGQFVKVELDRSQLPNLVATQIDVENSTSQVVAQVDDETGQQVNDNAATVKVVVDQKVVVPMKFRTRTGAVRTRMVRRTIHLEKTTNGSFAVAGLAKGLATIKVTRIVDGKTSAARRVVAVHPNKTANVTIRLRLTRTR